MKTLHITNGDGAAQIIKSTSLAGDILPWRDPMHHGPFPADASSEELAALRAAYLAPSAIDIAAITQDLRARVDLMRCHVEGAHVVLWFEHDLLDQLQILEILNWYANQPALPSRLDIICVDQHPDHPQFRGIGQLTPAQMRGLFESRRPVSDAMMTLAQAGWAAFRADTPARLVDFLQTDVSPLPFLRPALTRHLEEYPSLITGLTRTETQLLGLIASGVTTPQQIFIKNMDFETHLFIGDQGTFRILDRLCDLGLVCGSVGPKSDMQSNAQRYRTQVLALTDQGRAAMDGQIDPKKLVADDHWMGGVLTTPANGYWAWDQTHQSLAWQAS